jgi:peptide deformylase
MEIEALLDFVYGAANKTQRGNRRDPKRPVTVGLAANQVGIMKRITVVDMSVGHQGYVDIQVLVNPRITWTSKAVLTKPEGCVNFPEIWGVTQRFRTVKVNGLDRSGNELEMKLTGWPAVLIQHEIDHLDGHLFIDRLPDPSQAHLVRAEEFAEYRRMKEGWTKFVDVSDKIVRLGE